MNAKKSLKKKREKVKVQKASLTKNVLLPLVGFKPVELPDSTCVKLVYSDFRAVVAASSQGFYIYRANSLFDPDFTGVGGQPIGYDQWKVLYQKYRVIAVGIEVEAVSNTDGGVGLLAVGPSSLSTTFASAEEVAGLRHSKACVFSDAGKPAKISMLWHISQLYGVSDEVILAEDGYAALITANPASQYYIHVNTEMNTTTGEAMVWTKLTYYARLEIPFDTIDTVARHERAFRMRRRVPALTPTSSTADQRTTTAVQPVPTDARQTAYTNVGGGGVAPALVAPQQPVEVPCFGKCTCSVHSQ